MRPLVLLAATVLLLAGCGRSAPSPTFTAIQQGMIRTLPQETGLSWFGGGGGGGNPAKTMVYSYDYTFNGQVPPAAAGADPMAAKGAYLASKVRVADVIAKLRACVREATALPGCTSLGQGTSNDDAFHVQWETDEARGGATFRGYFDESREPHFLIYIWESAL